MQSASYFHPAFQQSFIVSEFTSDFVRHVSFGCLYRRNFLSGSTHPSVNENYLTVFCSTYQ